MTLAESLCKCSMNDGISQSELESGVSHVAGIGKTPVVFGLGLLRFGRISSWCWGSCASSVVIQNWLIALMFIGVTFNCSWKNWRWLRSEVTSTGSELP